MVDHGEFSGEPETKWLTDNEEPDRNMKMLDGFVFKDPDGREWAAPAGYDGLNGASIPRALWSLVGAPYVGDYRRAAIVHDYAVQEGKEPRKKADKMFYHACRAGGCSWLQARILYIGVRIGAWFGRSEELRDVSDSANNCPRLTRDANEIRVEAFFQDVCHAALVEADMEGFDEFAERVDREIESKLRNW